MRFLFTNTIKRIYKTFAFPNYYSIERVSFFIGVIFIFFPISGFSASSAIAITEPESGFDEIIKINYQKFNDTYIPGQHPLGQSHDVSLPGHPTNTADLISMELASLNKFYFNDLSFSETPADIFDDIFEKKQLDNLQNIDYKSSFKRNGAEWHTNFDADNHSIADKKDKFDLEIDTFYIGYRRKNQGISSVIGRQASPGGGVVGRIDGVTLKVPLNPQMLLGASAGFPVNLSDKTQIQNNKPFVAFNVKLPDLYKSLVLKPYVVLQQQDGFINRQSIGSEVNYTYKKSSFYQVADYDTQFDTINIWLLQTQIQRSNRSLYHASLEYRRNPAIDLDNALINEYRVSSLKELSAILSKKEMLAQANDRTAKNYSAKIGTSSPLNSSTQFSADLIRNDQIYKSSISYGTGYKVNHDFQNKFSTQLTLSNLFNINDVLLVELKHVDAKYYSSTSLSTRNQISLSKRHQLDIKLRISERESDSGEILLTTLPTVKFICRCSKKFESDFSVGYESWRFSGNTVQEDYNEFFANFNFRLNI